MATNAAVRKALQIGRSQATEVLKSREKARRRRKRALTASPGPAHVLLAEGDSWFDYPFHDVLKELEDEFGYDVESVAHKGDPIEAMAYGNGQLDDFTRKLEKLIDRGSPPRAILLSGGGNDIAGAEFGMLLNHAASAIAGLNEKVIEGVIDERIRMAYVTIMGAVTHVCEEKLGHTLPILVHGYDYPVPDGRGFLGGLWLLPGPWLEPGFREKGYDAIARRIRIAHDLIERFNVMLEGVCALPPFAHVRYVDLRNILSTGPGYKRWWANELHPTPPGFRRIAERFKAAIP